MKKVMFFIAVVGACILSACSGEIDRTIYTVVPERPAGQEDVIELAVDPIDTVRVGFIGLGMRGIGAIERYVYIPGAKIAALCDIRPEMVERAQKVMRDAGLDDVPAYSGTEDAWKGLCDRDDIDLV
ncbi:MAG: glycosyl hydrolase, partial [Muribaculum sp.]|nr:glycosyl hydrolase [Candidatus Merdivivens faecigallinarum]